MLFFVFLVAILNLGIGYALGSGLTLAAVLDRLPRRKAKPSADDDIADEAPLSRPATVAPPAASKDRKPEPPAKAKPSPQDVMASLNSFREKLGSASADLKLAKEDPQKFEQSATKLQHINHAYLEEAAGAISHLGDLKAAGDRVAAATCDAVTTGAKRVEQMSDDLDEMIDGGLEAAEQRTKLIDQSEAMQDAASAVESATQAAMDTATNEPTTPVDPPEESPPETTASAPSPEAAVAASEPANTFESVEALFDRLDDLLSEAEEETTQHVAAIRLDPLEDHEDNHSVISAVEAGVAMLAAEILGETQSFVGGRPAIMLLEGDSFDDATERLERLRQQVESTTFETAAGEVKATVTCAVADARRDNGRDPVIDQLNLALDESARLGANRTFHHDGAFPTPVPEAPVAVEPRTLAV